MKPSIKVIKRRREGDGNDLKTSEGDNSVKRNTREMVDTVKGWIAELHERKSARADSFSPLTVTTTAPAQQGN